MEINLAKSTTALRSDPSTTSEWESLLVSLEQLTQLCQDGDARSKLPNSHFQNLSMILETALSEQRLRYDVLTETFRFLRNSVVACRRNQDLIREETNLFEMTDRVFQRFLEPEVEGAEEVQLGSEDKDRDRTLMVVRCALQFLANSIVDNRENSGAVCSRFSEMLGSLTSTFGKDEKVIQYASMIAHLGLKQSPQALSLNSAFLTSLLDNLHLEFVIYAMESFVKYGSFINLYEELKPGERIRVLSFLNERPDLFKTIDEKIISLLRTNFVERSDYILRSKLSDKDDLFCWEIAVLLEVICTASSTEIESLKSDAVLLTTTLYLLKQIDVTGKGGTGDENVFAPVEDLAKLTSKSTSHSEGEVDDIRAHPTFQFKAHLIRLIANLAHRNTLNQDKVRELGCLPIILDNCKIDARNPFIAQWSILAIRNLCEGNIANQAYIQEVQRVDTENLLPKLELVELSEQE